MTDARHPTAFCETPPLGPAADLAARLAGVVPALSTARLQLRAPRVSDFEAYAGILSGPRGRFILDPPVTRADIWRDFCGLVATWILRGHGTWTVTETPAEDPAGFVLIGAEPGNEAHELGFMLTEAAEGRGIAFEAAVAARDWAWSVLQVPRLVSYVAPGNTRSAALAQRLGGVRGTDYDHETQVYHYPRPEGAAA